MREILFRGKDIAGNWYAGNLAVVKQDVPNCAGTIKAGSYISNEYGLPFAYQIRPETVSQFTGFTDKNGKRIFEGDILYIEDDDGNKYVTQVWYERGGLVIDVKGCDYDYTVIGWLEYYYSMEVIGNIHDNPELLKEQK